MSTFKFPADKQIGLPKLKTWIQMNALPSAVHSPGPAFVYIKDIEPETAGPVVDPFRPQSLIEEKAVREGDPTVGIPVIHPDDLMDGFWGTRLEPDQVSHAAAMERHQQEQLRRQKQRTKCPE